MPVSQRPGIVGAAVLGITQITESRVFQLLDYGLDWYGRTIVDHEAFEVGKSLRTQTPERTRQLALAIVNRYHHGDSGHCPFHARQTVPKTISRSGKPGSHRRRMNPEGGR